MAVFVLCCSGSARADFALVSTSGLPNVSSLANRHSAAWVLPTGCFGDDSPEAGPLEARSHMESFLERAQYSPTSDQPTIHGRKYQEEGERDTRRLLTLV
ncbi:hypothetical protein GX48_03814 [Paracoccidioides brasiliensis]|nr:hypothetical protein GX48_03814 [Paracoccidioides brasiliensis]